ncbi:hypothetical protein PsYK624_109350 [Phanerochaete sordida]|uniref:Uncharacterized protein n=1 Tax=Phanerochaete sordida TaxID=48140 RepID=A0A9P3GH07_9APHY|nr:hypothetical protein PsYK624_109350 [Phanerochaete sordida]
MSWGAWTSSTVPVPSPSSWVPSSTLSAAATLPTVSFPDGLPPAPGNKDFIIGIANDLQCRTCLRHSPGAVAANIGERVVDVLRVVRIVLRCRGRPSFSGNCGRLLAPSLRTPCRVQRALVITSWVHICRLIQSSCNLCSGGVLCLGPSGIRGMPRLGGENAEKALEKLVALLCLLKLVLLQEIACTDTRSRRRGRRIALHAGTTGCDDGRKQGSLRGGARRAGGMRRWG